MSKYLVVYHQEDNDGVLSAAMFIDYLVKKLEVERCNIDTLPANYNILSEKFNTKKRVKEYFGNYDHVMFTDISFNDPNMMCEALKATHVVWIDHHKPIIDEMKKRVFDYSIDGSRDWTKSAILNMYTYLYDPLNTGDNVPLLLRYLSALDSWSWEREKLSFHDCRCINEAINAEYNLDLKKFIKDIDVFMNVLDENDIRFQCFYDKGDEIVKMKDENDRIFVEKCGEGGWKVAGSRSAVAVVTSGPTSSIMFKSVEDKYQNAIAFKRESNGNWVISLYNTKDDSSFHCGEYLKSKYNGGGHEGAAGCTIGNIDTIYKMFKEKSI